jgi:isopentenyldiphosphate isomerase
MQITKDKLREMVEKSLSFTNVMVGENTFILASIGENSVITNDDTSELFQQFDSCDEPIMIDGVPVVFLRRECHGKDRVMNTFHRGAGIIIMNSHGQLLIPTRSSKKDLYPLMKDISIGEHVKAGESYIQAACRGGIEELGLEIDRNKLHLAIHASVKNELQWEFSCYYLYLMGTQKIEISSEVKNINWIHINDLQNKNLAVTINIRPDLAKNYEYVVNNIKRFI